MKILKIVKGLFLAVLILLLLAAIGIGSYIFCRTYLERQITPQERIQMELERVKSVYEGNLAYAKKESQKKDFVVILNPAHGGEDIGTENSFGMEKDITLAICKQVVMKNKDSSLGIYLTRDDDILVDENGRLAFIGQIEPDMFIDVHLNEDDFTGAYGTSVYYTASYFNKELSNSEFADIMERSVVTAIEGFACGVFEMEDKEATLLKDMKIPAIRIVCGDLSDEKEGYLLTTEPYQSNLAQGMLDGICLAKERIVQNGEEVE